MCGLSWQGAITGRPPPAVLPYRLPATARPRTPRPQPACRAQHPTNKAVLREPRCGREVHENIHPEAPLVEVDPQLVAEPASGLDREQRDRTTIRHRPFRAQYGQVVPVAEPLVQLPDQHGIVNRQNLTRRRFASTARSTGLAKMGLSPGSMPSASAKLGGFAALSGYRKRGR